MYTQAHNMYTTCTQHVSEWGGLTGWFQFMTKRRTAFPESRGERGGGGREENGRRRKKAGEREEV